MLQIRLVIAPRWSKKQKPPGRAALAFESFNLQGGFDLESPRLEQRLRDVFGILIAARLRAQPGGTKISMAAGDVALEASRFGTKYCQKI